MTHPKKNLVYFLAFNHLRSVNPRTALQLFNYWPDLSTLFQLKTPQLEGLGLPKALAKALACFDFKYVEEDLKWLEASPDHHLLTWEHEHYPTLLKEIADPPIVLYAQGRLNAFKQPCLAVVGSRNPSISGSENAKSFSKALAEQGVTIVSGLALGIDAQAHRGCLEAQGCTLAVLGTGIDCIYPRQHKGLAEEIRQKGLILSEFPLKSPPIAGHFPLRNRIISGLSLCTLVIEAAIRSGSLITAHKALEQNRDVLAIPGSIHNPMARGCHQLVQQGAKLITSVTDVLEELGLDQVQQMLEKTPPPLVNGRENLVQFIGFETTTVDQILNRSGLNLEQVTHALAELELRGTIVSVPGGYVRYDYER